VAASAGTGRPTAKARAMLQELDLDASSIPAAGERLTVADIGAWLSTQRKPAHAPGLAAPAAPEQTPSIAGEYRELAGEERGMVSTVLWHRDRAAHGYLEIEFDPKPWDDYAADYAKQNNLMLSPLLPLLAFRLVELAKASPRINATIVNDRCYQYRQINLGFTVQVGQTLYLAVVQGAQEMNAAQFIDALGEVQRHAMARKLRPAESSGATLAFSSMARWNVSRHTPLLPPYTSLIVAHAAPRASGHAVLGASYDHRLLSGFDAAQVLGALAQLPA
jgi:pyruvate dehydrogenase E2 component (dihydrolipoamide acetyltransferase)